MNRHISEGYRRVRRHRWLVALAVLAALVAGLMVGLTQWGQSASRNGLPQHLPSLNCRESGCVSVVGKFWDMDGDELGVSFSAHAMVVRVPRDHPKHDEWIALLKRSRDERTKVEFDSAPGYQTLTHLEAVPKEDDRYHPDM